ncbi:hypothetical protein MHU86_2370 [Fragilaria crotonensis]|nr:hypothetical protein MHU86_2370 [Fragilaria crotonensis]
MAENNPENIVRDPHDHDVLLGRGGLSNHHPGNIWYRRLVRSNNTLYGQSKKHTKVLVARAIVHHVQSQDPPGRFLERDKTTGLWILASYDKAVHKTSQALREKRVLKNDGSIQVVQTILIPIAPAEDGITSEQAANVATKAVTVAQENAKLSRKTAAVTTTAATEVPENELADTKWSRLATAVAKKAATVAQKNEHLDTKLSKKPANITKSAAKVALENEDLDTELSQRAEVVTTTAANVAQENELLDTKLSLHASAVAQENDQFDTKQTESWFWSDHKRRKEASSSLSGRIPSPTEHIRQQPSTLLRYLAKSQKGLEDNPISYDINSTNDTMLMRGGSDQSIELHQFDPVDTQCMEPVSLDNPLYQNMFDHDGISSHSIEPLSLNNTNHNDKKRYRDSVESLLPPDAPSLTRITTQMPDGLQSFWPVDDAKTRQEAEEVKDAASSDASEKTSSPVL